MKLFNFLLRAVEETRNINNCKVMEEFLQYKWNVDWKNNLKIG
jgi:hypothetical protein